jgi:hypothetical protein
MNELKRNYFLEATIVTEIGYTSHSGNELLFYLDVVTIEDKGIDWYVQDTSFKAMTVSSVTCTPLSVENITESNDEAYSSILLIDESSDWFTGIEGIENINYSIKKGMKDGKGKYAVGLYGTENHTGVSPAYFCDENSDGNIFDNSYEYVLEELSLFSQHVETAVKSNLYDALDLAIDKIVSENPPGNHRITLITGKGNEIISSNTYYTILNKCNANNIKIDLVATYPPNVYLKRLVLQTGGFILCNNLYTLPGYYNDYITETCYYFMDDLCRKNYKKHRVHCKAVKTTNWLSTSILSGSIGLHYLLPSENIYEEIDFDQELPVYLIVP